MPDYTCHDIEYNHKAANKHSLRDYFLWSLTWRWVDRKQTYNRFRNNEPLSPKIVFPVQHTQLASHKSSKEKNNLSRSMKYNHRSTQGYFWSPQMCIKGVVSRNHGGNTGRAVSFTNKSIITEVREYGSHMAQTLQNHKRVSKTAKHKVREHPHSTGWQALNGHEHLTAPQRQNSLLPITHRLSTLNSQVRQSRCTQHLFSASVKKNWTEKSCEFYQ